MTATSGDKLGSKITAIVDDKGFPMCGYLSASNIMDSTLTIPTVENLDVKHHVNLIADKGYISLANKKKLFDRNINLIYPYRKNQKKKNTEPELKLLKKRYIVENFSPLIKQFRRIRNRYDRLAISYCNVISLGLIYVAFRKINRLTPEIFD